MYSGKIHISIYMDPPVPNSSTLLEYMNPQERTSVSTLLKYMDPTSQPYKVYSPRGSNISGIHVPTCMELYRISAVEGALSENESKGWILKARCYFFKGVCVTPHLRPRILTADGLSCDYLRGPLESHLLLSQRE